MAENDWLNGYLEAILDVGTDKTGRRGGGEERSRTMNSFKKTIFSSKFDDKLMSERLLHAQKEKPVKLFSPTKYFVEEVVNSFDETDLHRTWIKVSKLYGFSQI